MYTCCIATSGVRKMSQHKYTLSLQYVHPFFFTDIFGQIIRSKIITTAFFGYGAAHLPAADCPEACSGVQPHGAPPANMPLENGLRKLVGLFLNNPEALINMLRIEPGPGGRFVVWIALELADI